jgi:hypothetical protein
MEEDRYNVILCYDPDDSQIHRKVVSALFEKAPLVAQRFEEAKFNGRMIIRRGVDMKTAKGFRRLFGDTGATCTFHKITATPPDCPDENRAAVKGSPPPQASPDPTAPACPNCGHPVSQSEVCRECGIIIAKAKARRSLPQEPAPVVAKPEPSSSTPSLMAAVMDKAQTYCSPLVTLLKKIQHPIPVDNISGWGQTVADRMIRCGLLFAIALVVEIGMLVMGRMMWSLYTATVSGEQFLKSFPERAQVYQHITRADPLALGFDATLTMLWLGLLVGCVCQLLHLIHHLYESQNLIGKFIIWFAPLIGAGAWIMTRQMPYLQTVHAMLLVTLPALCLLSSCLYLARALLPELGQVLKFGVSKAGAISGSRGTVLQNIRQWVDSFSIRR